MNPVTVPKWMGPEAVQFLGKFLPDHQDILDPNFSFLRETRQTLLERWRGQVNNALEIGVCRGEYSQCIMDVMKPSRLYLVDSWDTHDPNYTHAKRQAENMAFTVNRFKKAMDDGRVVVVQDESGDELPRYEAGWFDWAFVDGDHRFHWVLVDLIMCNRVVAPTGTIAGHDFSALFGIPAAVAEFCRHYPWRLFGMTPGPHSTFTLRHLPS